MADADGSKCIGTPQPGISRPEYRGWWTDDPADLDDSERWGLVSRLDRVADGIPNRLERLAGIGDAQVPSVVRTAWRLLNE